MSISREAVALFEELLDDISKQNNPRPHKRIKFVNRNLLDCKMMESKLQQYFEDHFDEEERYNLAQSLVDAEGECRVCECLLYLIQHVEKRIEKHQGIFCSICEMIQEARNIEDDDDLLAEVVTKCSLLVYDSFHGLCSLKRLIKFISTSYQVSGLIILVIWMIVILH